MSVLLPLSLAPLRVTALCALAAGLIYFFKTSPMGYHQRYLQIPFADLDPRVQRLMLALLHATGSGLIAIGLTLGYLAWGPIPAHAPGAVLTASLLVVSSMVPMAIVTLSLARYTPWWLILALGLSSAAGLFWFLKS